MDLFSTKQKNTTIIFPTEYNEIINRLKNVNPVSYIKTRNHIEGAVTYLSPYISRGVISVKQVGESVLANGHKKNQIEKFLQELAWREYFQRVWQTKGDDIFTDIKQAQPDVDNHQMLSALQNATTGINALDNQIEFLLENGYMHNHARMYTASLACNVGKTHWLKPSKWMYFHLLDGDIASNNCSWQWVAGTFSSKKYYFNQENLNKYTGSNQNKTYMDKSYEVIASMDTPDCLLQTQDLNLSTHLPQTPHPLIDTDKPTLIYNSYNLDPQWRKGENVNRVLLLEPSHFQKYPVSQKVIQFIINLSENIKGIQIFVGEFEALKEIPKTSKFIFKEHPLSAHYEGTQDQRDWIYPQVTGYYNSFFSFWKKCQTE